MGENPYTSESSSIKIKLQAGSLLIELGPETQRNIASISIPQTAVRFEFLGVSDEEKHSFMSYFDKRFHRGGG